MLFGVGRVPQFRRPYLVGVPAERVDLPCIESLPEHDEPEHPEMMYLVFCQHGGIPWLLPV